MNILVVRSGHHRLLLIAFYSGNYSLLFSSVRKINSIELFTGPFNVSIRFTAFSQPFNVPSSSAHDQIRSPSVEANGLYQQDLTGLFSTVQLYSANPASNRQIQRFCAPKAPGLESAHQILSGHSIFFSAEAMHRACPILFSIQSTGRWRQPIGKRTMPPAHFIQSAAITLAPIFSKSYLSPNPYLLNATRNLFGY